MLKRSVVICLSFFISLYFAEPALYLEPISNKQMSETLIPPIPPVPATAAARAAAKDPLRIPFGVFHTDTQIDVKPLVFRNPAGKASNTTGIYLTDLKQSGTTELNVTANPPKMILKFDKSSKALLVIFVSSELKTAAEVTSMIEGISLQINEFLKDSPDSKNKIKNVWRDIQSKTNPSSAFGDLKRGLKAQIEAKIAAL